MQARAAIAWEAGKRLLIESTEVRGPREGELLLRVVTAEACHMTPLSCRGRAPGLFPAVLGKIKVGKMVAHIIGNRLERTKPI